MGSGIYKITNLINNKIYIGQAVNLKVRIRTHEKYDTPEKYKGSLSFDNELNMPIHMAIMKYHLNNFKIEIIEECPINLLDEREKYWISYYNCKTPNGYNLTDGGQGGHPKRGESNHFSKYTEEQINEVKKFLKEGKRPKEVFQLCPQISIDSIYAINLGKSWRDENESYPLNNKQHKRAFNDEEKIKIKELFEKDCKNYSKMYLYKVYAKKYNCSERTIMNAIKD